MKPEPKNIGAHALYKVEGGLQFHVTITNYQRSYGVHRYEITPHYTSSLKTRADHLDIPLPQTKKWVNSDKLTILTVE